MLGFMLDEKYHTPECIAKTKARRVEALAWTAKYPEHCTRCGARGTFYYSGDFYEPPSDEPCEHCTEKGLCARCGKPGLPDEEVGPCPSCGWNYDDSVPVERECEGCTPYAQRDWQKEYDELHPGPLSDEDEDALMSYYL